MDNGGNMIVSKLGDLRHQMTTPQIDKLIAIIDGGFPSVVGYHGCGLARVVVGGTETHIDEEGKIVKEKDAKARKRKWAAGQPKRGRPRKQA